MASLGNLCHKITSIDICDLHVQTGDKIIEISSYLLKRNYHTENQVVTKSVSNMNQKREIEESYFNSKQLILFPKLKCMSPFVYTVEIIWF